MTSFKGLLIRNIKIYFKDKIFFFTSLITPLILLFLFIAFLNQTYRNIILSFFPSTGDVSSSLVNGYSGCFLLSSIMSVTSVTVSFSTNLLSVQDKYRGQLSDFNSTPISRVILSISYYFSSVISTLIICSITLIISFIYISIVGWYISFIDVLGIILVTIILIFFGTSLSSLINLFLKTEGQVTAITVIISSGYGFLAGAYMPLSETNTILRRILMFLPGTYGSIAMKNHALSGCINEFSSLNMPSEAIDKLKYVSDISLDFFGMDVSLLACYLVLICSTLVFLALFIVLSKFRKTSARL